MLKEIQQKITHRDQLGVKSLSANSYTGMPSRLFPILYQSNALVGEAGEAANIVKKMVRDSMLTFDEKRQNDLDAREKGYESMDHKRKSDLGKELGDIVMYCGLLAQAAGIQLDQAVVAKFNEVSEKMKLNIFINEEGTAQGSGE